MGLYVNTNVGSLNSQRQLNQSSLALGRSFERLSSGLRINGARDDAAGLSISTRLTSQVTGLKQAVRNTSDGISLAQTAEGALNETTNILQRIRELAVQAANDTNNDSDRSSLQAEVSQLLSEIDRIAETTQFNGINVLDGTMVYRDIQAGAGVGETLSVSISGAATKDLARQARYDGGTFVSATTFNGSNFELSSVDGSTFHQVRATVSSDDQLSSFGKEFSAIAKAEAINVLSATTGVRAIVGPTEVSGLLNVAHSGDINLNASAFFEINGVEFSGFTITSNDADGALTDAINAQSDATGVIASITDTGALKLTAQDGRNIHMVFATPALADNMGQFDDLVVGTDTADRFDSVPGSTLQSFVATGKLTLQSEQNFEIRTAGASTLIGFQSSGLGVYGVNSTYSMSSVNISDRDNAVKAIDIVDLALEHVSGQRAKLGALQNRMESTINSLNMTAENLSASRSRIMDADFAAESAQLARNQIIQQAGVSMLAQTNLQPQIALALLG